MTSAARRRFIQWQSVIIPLSFDIHQLARKLPNAHLIQDLLDSRACLIQTP
jgi:hypothetical protein